MELDNIDARIERGETVALPSLVEGLFAEGRQIWDDNSNDFHFRDFIAADYERVYQALAMLREQAETFLEWGSGLGIIASSAGLLGYQAYGIEIDPKLYRQSVELAQRYGTTAEFSFGSFVPDDYEWTGEFEDDFMRTILDEHDGYGDLDMALSDFDLVYSYPWPGEREFFLDVMRRYGRPGALFMTYDVREGIHVSRI